MEIDTKRVAAKVSLEAIQSNLEVMHSLVPEGTKCIPVIKADGYGHGAVPIAHRLEPLAYVWGFAVATAEEAFTLFDSGVRKPILLLGGVFEGSIDGMLARGIRFCVSDASQGRMVAERARELRIPANIHVAVDTGMHRIGFSPDEGSADAVKALLEDPYLIAEGLFTHYARADEEDLAAALSQLKRYLAFRQMLTERGIAFRLCHTANSASVLHFPEAHLDAVRCGITMYGLTPSDEMTALMEENGVCFRPAMTLISHVIHLAEIDAGEEIGYGGTVTLTRKTRIATVPVGYADGFPRMLSGKGEVLIRGKRAKILGRICMDQFMADVTDIPEVSCGDPVVLLGKMDGEEITAEEIGRLSGRFNYELVCCITSRVPRVYGEGA